MGNFFMINAGFIESGAGLSYCGDDNYIEAIHMDVECPILMSLIKRDFLLKDENAAKLFEKLSFPMNQGSDINSTSRYHL
jgi:hypothetical protein